MLKIDHLAVLIAIAALVVLSIWPLPSSHGSGHDDDGHGGGHGDSHDSGGHDAAPHWSYGGADGPEHWGALSAAFAACSHGAMQSPIDLNAGFTVATLSHAFDYKPSALNIVHNGHTVQANYAPGSSMTVQGKVYDLLQFHFHAPSEHAIGGHRAPMEVHLVHQSADGELAVLGIMMNEGAANEALAGAWSKMPMHETAAADHGDVMVDAAALLPATGRYYHYKGSLTTPPCSEGVRWFVLQTPITVSTEQIAKFVEAAAPNARPLQPINKRLVVASP
jgi:carbonic anhydrase